MNSVKKAHYKLRLSKEFRSDVEWWYDYTARLSGRAQILGEFAALRAK